MIDDNINFYEELMKDDNDDNDDNDEVDKNTNNICLITREQLDKTQIKLECNHTFNYLPLFKDLLQKITSPYTIRTFHNEIECPYCRSITKYLLPSSYDIIGIQNNIYKINNPSNYQMKLSCSYNPNINCNNKKYMTPLGPYCIKHYDKVKKNKISSKDYSNKSDEYIHIANNYTIPQLKIILKHNRLSITGKKNDLIERIINANIFITQNT